MAAARRLVPPKSRPMEYWDMLWAGRAPAWILPHLGDQPVEAALHLQVAPMEFAGEHLADLFLALVLVIHKPDLVAHAFEQGLVLDDIFLAGNRAVAGNDRVEIEFDDFVQGLGPFDGAAATGIVDQRREGRRDRKEVARM